MPNSNSYALDLDESLKFIKALGKDPATTWLRCLKANSSSPGHHGISGKADWDWIERKSKEGFNLCSVIGNATSATGKGGGVTNIDITGMPAFFVEWDDGARIEEQTQRWQKLGLPEPTMMVSTGGKSVHCYWVLVEQMEPEPWQILQKRLIAHCNSDPTVCNPSRLMRLPGSIYYNKTSGEATGQCRIIRAIETRYSATQIEECLPAPEPAPERLEAWEPNQIWEPRSIDEINSAADCIPKRVVGTNTYRQSRYALCGCSAALKEAGAEDPDGMAVALLGHLWPDEKSAWQALKTSTTRAAGSFWKIAHEHGHEYWPSVLKVRENEELQGQKSALGTLEGAYEIDPEPSTPDEKLNQRLECQRTQATQKNGIRADERPIDVQAASHLLGKHRGNLACVGGSLFAYNPQKGIWESRPDAEVKQEIRNLLLRFWQKGKKDAQKLFCYGSADHVKRSVESLKIAAGSGPLSKSEPPAVIVFEDGTFDLSSKVFGEHKPEYGATFMVAAPFVQSADCPPEVKRVVETCLSEGSESIIRALCRWVIDPTIRYGEAFHFLGDSGTGKGLLIQLVSSLLPPENRSSLAHPGNLDSPEKLHQYVVGRRLILFPDAPARPRDAKHCGLFYELVENTPQTTRRLHVGDSEIARKLHARCILGSTRPLQFPDGRDGFLRRTLTIKTLPRLGEPDASLREVVEGETKRHQQMRGELASWALSMPLPEVLEVLNRRDAFGLLSDAAEDAAKASDSVSLFADECLIPRIEGPNTEVTQRDWSLLFEAYAGWCKHAGQFPMSKDNFQGQLRKVLGPKRCLPRGRETMAEAEVAGRDRESRRNLPRLDAGFGLRSYVIDESADAKRPREDFDFKNLGTGGVEMIAALPQAMRTD